MYSKEAKMMVAEQVSCMLENNVLRECGMESFMGWLEDGDVYYTTYADHTKEQIEEAIKLSKEIANKVDEISWILDIRSEE